MTQGQDLAAVAEDTGSASRKTTGVLLAAGSGSRLGRGPKALLAGSSGRTLLELALEALAEGGCDELVLVLGCRAPEVASHVHQPGVRMVVNPAWESGMGSSFALGLKAVSPGNHALVALVDQPGTGPEMVRRLLAAYRPGRVAAAGFAGTSAGESAGESGGLRRGHPVLFDAGHLRAAGASAAGDSGAREWLAAHRELVDLVDCSDLGSGLDIDTVQDLHLLD